MNRSQSLFLKDRRERKSEFPTLKKNVAHRNAMAESGSLTKIAGNRITNKNRRKPDRSHINLLDHEEKDEEQADQQHLNLDPPEHGHGRSNRKKKKTVNQNM